MGWSLLPNALRPFKTYCTSPSITSQLVLHLWQTVEIGPLGHVSLSSPKLCPKMRPHDIVRDSHSQIRCSTVSLPLRHLLHKGFIFLPIIYKWPFRLRCPVSRPIWTDSCCLLMFSSLVSDPLLISQAATQLSSRDWMDPVPDLIQI